jgi:prepilin-type N-terminal cleavage/methylation domain-containing protein
MEVAFPIKQRSSGFSLIELLVVIALITALISLAVPAWTLITRHQAKNSAVSLVMEGLEQARIAASSGKKEVWVVFRNELAKKASLRLVRQEATNFTPLGNWITLPQGITFQTGGSTLMEQKPPDVVIAAALGSQLPKGATLGSILFLRSGRIGLPQPGGPTLSLQLAESKAPIPQSITISRATGRSSIR